MKSKTCILILQLECDKVLLVKNTVKIRAPCAIFGVLLKMNSFLGHRCFQRLKKLLQDGELFVKNAFFLCSPQKTIELCAELDNLGIQP